MGIYDRHYVRDDHNSGRGRLGGGGGGSFMSAMRMWSVTTWLIIACVAIFALDGFAGRMTEMSGLAIRSDLNGELPANAVLAPGTEEAEKNLRIGAVSQRQWYVPGDPQPVAVQTVRKMKILESYLHFSTMRGFMRIEFWRLIGFQFLHADFYHLLFNMVGLFFFGPMVERYLGSKRYAAFYLLCGIFGALMYVLLNLGGIVVESMGYGGNLPGLIFNNPYTSLIGASAGVFGVVIAGAYLRPNDTVLLFMILPMRLKTLAWAIVIIAMIKVLMGDSNAGGEAAHLGGAAAGFYFIRNTKHLHDFFDILGRVDPTSHHYRERRVVKGREKAAKRDTKVDEILDKIKRDGIQSLTARERKTLKDRGDE